MLRDVSLASSVAAGPRDLEVERLAGDVPARPIGTAPPPPPPTSNGGGPSSPGVGGGGGGGHGFRCDVQGGYRER